MAAFSSNSPSCFFHSPNISIRTTTVAITLFRKISSPCFRAQSDPLIFYYGNMRKSMATLCLTSEAPASTVKDPTEMRRLYVGNIPRTINNEDLANIFEEHGSVEKAEVMYDKYSKRSRRFGFVTMASTDDANAAIEKLNQTEIGDRKIKVNIVEIPVESIDLSQLEAEDSMFIDTPHVANVGNLAKLVTTELLKKFISDKVKFLSAKICRVPGTSKSRGFGLASFSSEEDMDAAISKLNGLRFEGKRICISKITSRKEQYNLSQVNSQLNI